MCGRFQLALSWRQIVDLYGVGSSVPETGWSPSWSVCPTHTVPTLHQREGERALSPARWGFPMPWLARQGKDPWSRALINARIEQAASKRTWSAPLRSDRRVVPATAYIEWIKLGSRRLPVAISSPDGAVLHLAAVVDTFDRDGAPTQVVSLLTTQAAPSVRSVHDRMPVLLPIDRIDAWIAPGPAPDPTEWPVPDLGLAALPTSINRAGHRAEPPEPADWSLGEALPQD